MAGEKGALVSGTPKESSATRKEKAGSSEAASATEDLAAGDGEDARPATKVKMLMSHEDIESILRHKARSDSFKEFQARVAKEVEETGEFEVSEEHIKNVQEARAWIRKEFLNVRSQYPHLVWEEDDDEGQDGGADTMDAALKSN